MNKRNIHIENLIRKNISEVDPSAEVILYGSRARGDQRAGSDWDILVLTDYPASLKIERDFRNHLYELELQTGEVFSIFVYSKHDWNTKQMITPFFHNVSQEGIRL